MLGKILKEYLRIIGNYGFTGIYLFFLLLLKYLKIIHVYNYYSKCHKAIENWLVKHGYLTLMMDYSDVVTQNLDSPELVSGCGNIWVCWLQGEDNMPPIVQKTYSSILRHSNGRQVHLITLSNYMDYIEISQEIIVDYKRGTLMAATLSDLIRFKLLAKYGGLWLDATILLTGDVEEEMFNHSFYSIKNPPVSNFSVTEYKWAGFILGTIKNANYFKRLAFAFETYLKNEKVILHYLMVDYFIDLMYKNDESFKTEIDSIDVSNVDMHTLRESFNEPFDKQKWDKIMGTTHIFKLTYKGKPKEFDEYNHMTFYGYLMSHYDII